jgi:8-oxo-dGTP pyrophosphatase MutT (NUDIX family)
MKKTYTQLIDDRLTSFTHLGSSYIPEFKNVTAVGVLPFTADGLLVAINHIRRGYDMIGGHVEPSDVTPIETIKREAAEEAMITLKNLALIEVIASDYFEDRTTYLLIYAAQVETVLPYVVNDETNERLVISIDAFLQKYTVGDKDLMADALRRSKIAAR